MKRLKNFFTRFLDDDHLIWIFILPSALLLLLFALPLLSLFIRAINDDFFSNAFSAQAFKALRLSLVTSTITMLVTILFGTPLAYLLAGWKFKLKS